MKNAPEPEKSAAVNRLSRQFELMRPNHVWVSRVIYFLWDEMKTLAASHMPLAASWNEMGD